MLPEPLGREPGRVALDVLGTIVVYALQLVLAVFSWFIIVLGAAMFEVHGVDGLIFGGAATSLVVAVSVFIWILARFAGGRYAIRAAGIGLAMQFGLWLIVALIAQSMGVPIFGSAG